MDASRINILICEDEDDIRNLLKIYVESQKYNVFEAKNGAEALDIIDKNEIHLLLLDIMMPVKNGFEVVKELRKNNNLMPIIILTARVEDDNKIFGLDLGADDYICKPFNYKEVLSRINAQLRRYFKFDTSKRTKYVNGNITMDIEKFEVYKDGKSINFNLQEFKILEVFMSAPGKVFTKEQIYERAWDSEYLSDDNTIMVHISRLRDKLSAGDNINYIETIRGLGYRMIKIEK